MSSPQIVIIVLGLLLGYWGVSKLMDFQGRHAKNKGAAPHPDPRARPWPAKPGAPEWWEVLQVDRNATLDVVHAAYEARVRPYHPDKLAGMGEDSRRLADEKFAEINAAYYAVLKERGLR